MFTYFWISSTYVVPTMLMFSGGENRKVFWGDFFEHPKRYETSRDKPLPVGLNFCDPCLTQFSLVYWNFVLLMIMGQNRGYERILDIIISSQPYWNYHGFLSVTVDLLGFSVPWGDSKNCWIVCLWRSAPRLALCNGTLEWFSLSTSMQFTESSPKHEIKSRQGFFLTFWFLVKCLIYNICLKSETGNRIDMKLISLTQHNNRNTLNEKWSFRHWYQDSNLWYMVLFFAIFWAYWEPDSRRMQ